jgi:Flp pilus assembly pilin Flp
MRPFRRRTPGRLRGRDDGAAAVEFALVLPILVLILFGIIDYGLFFSNSISAQSGVQTAARQAIVGNFDTSCTAPTDAGSPSPEVGELMCMVKKQTSAITGTDFVKVILPVDANDPAHPNGGWYVDHQLIVCEVIAVQGLTGYVPLPRHDGAVAIRSRIVTELETVTTPKDDPGGQEDNPPGGWDWCT